jgi:hypothetical protein
MKTITVAFNHLPYEEMMKFYEWHKGMVSNFKLIWDIKDIPPEKFIDPKDKNIMSMDLDNLWANINKYYTVALTWFANEHADYFILMERDVCILDKNFETKIVDYMQAHNILACFPFLHSNWINPTHPFAQQMNSLRSKQWTITSMVVMRRQALEFYANSLIQFPDFWGEIRMPTILGDAGMQITENPFINAKYFYSPPKGPEVTEEQKSLTNEAIQSAIKESCSVIHPMKDYSRYPIIKEMIDAQETIKKNTI